MQLIIGLGNPGKEYENTRHNVGYLVVEAILARASQLYRLNSLKWEHSNRFEANIIELNLKDQQFLVVKPTTFINNSGQAVEKLRAFYKLNAEDLIVIHDELALMLGRVRIRIGGESAGHNGVASIIDHLGLDNFWRVRIGINSPDSIIPSATDFVLSRFSTAETDSLNKLIDQVSNYLLESLLTNTLMETSFKI